MSLSLLVGLGALPLLMAASAGPGPEAKGAEAKKAGEARAAAVKKALEPVWARFGFKPEVVITPDSVRASLNLAWRSIDTGMFHIDRRPNKPKYADDMEVPSTGGLLLQVQWVPELPQIMTQYMAPPSGPTAHFALQSPEGKMLAQESWYGPADFKKAASSTAQIAPTTQAVAPEREKLIFMLRTPPDAPAALPGAILEALASLH